MRIEGLELIDKLYREGRISRSTWWRGRKRGWVEVDYHQPHKKGDSNWWDTNIIEEMYRILPKIASQTIAVWSKVWDNNLVKDLVQDTILYLYEQGESYKNPKLFYTSAKFYMINCLRLNKKYREYGIAGNRIIRTCQLEYVEKVVVKKKDFIEELLEGDQK